MIVNKINSKKGLLFNPQAIFTSLKGNVEESLNRKNSKDEREEMVCEAFWDIFLIYLELRNIFFTKFVFLEIFE